MLVTKQLAIDFHCMQKNNKKKIKKNSVNCLVTIILQNIFSSQQKKENSYRSETSGRGVHDDGIDMKSLCMKIQLLVMCSVHHFSKEVMNKFTNLN